MKKTAKTSKRNTRTKKASSKARLASPNKKSMALIGVIILVFGAFGLWKLFNTEALTATGIDTSDQAAVNATYKKLWEASASVPSGWTGSVSTCKAGNISEQARIAHLNSVNFARRLNDLEPVAAARLTDSTQAAVQKTALLQEANFSRTYTSGGKTFTYGLMHYPPNTGLKCYSTVGDSTSAQSNLAYAYPMTPNRVIDLYLDDRGDSNTSAGHRRWLFSPDAEVFAFGMTEKASAIKVVGLRQDSTNNDPLWVQWPANGWFPSTMEPGGRWSLSSRTGVKFDNATIAVKKNGVSVATRVESRGGNSGYRPAIVWRMVDGVDTTARYTVTITNVKTPQGVTMNPYTYTVRFFKPY